MQVSPFNISTFNQILNTKTIGRSAVYLCECDSTNEYLKRESLRDILDGHLLLADNQTCGKGTGGKTWISEKARNLTFSLFLKNMDCEDGLLTPKVALSVLRAIGAFVPKQIQIKYPNDLVCDGEKLMGCLIERRWQGSEDAGTIIGIGLNVNQTRFSVDMKKATSLASLCDCFLSRELILAQICKELEQVLGQSQQKSQREINRHLLHVDETVNVYCPRFSLGNGIFKGLNEMGHIILQTDDTLEIIECGDARITQ